MFRNVLLLPLLVLLVLGDDIGMDGVSTDKDTTSDEAPTESMNAVSPDQHDVGSSSSEASDAPAANEVTAPEPAAVAPNSVEVEDEDEVTDSGEDMTKKVSSRSANPPPPPPPPPPPQTPQVQHSPRFLPVSPAHTVGSPSHVVESPAPVVESPAYVVESPALPPPEPVVPQPKAAVRSRSSKRRSRTNRRPI